MVLALQFVPSTFIHLEITIVFIKEESLIVDRGGAAYVGELGHELKPPVSIHVAR